MRLVREPKLPLRFRKSAQTIKIKYEKLSNCLSREKAHYGASLICTLFATAPIMSAVITAPPIAKFFVFIVIRLTHRCVRVGVFSQGLDFIPLIKN